MARRRWIQAFFQRKTGAFFASDDMPMLSLLALPSSLVCTGLLFSITLVHATRCDFDKTVQVSSMHASLYSVRSRM